jgi:hypothetical protein
VLLFILIIPPILVVAGAGTGTGVVVRGNTETNTSTPSSSSTATITETKSGTKKKKDPNDIWDEGNLLHRTHSIAFGLFDGVMLSLDEVPYADELVQDFTDTRQSPE